MEISKTNGQSVEEYKMAYAIASNKKLNIFV